MQLGLRFGSALQAGTVVHLHGTLGSGKTVFARGVAGAFGVTGAVTSPTFTIVREYPCSPPLLHVDLYRVTSEEEYLLLGIEELVPEAITLIEWPEHAGNAIEPATHSVTIEVVDEESRTLSIEPDSFVLPEPPEGGQR